MHKDAAGIATDVATMIRDAMITGSVIVQRSLTANSHISHHTGAGLSAFPCQTIELMKRFKHPIATHIM